MPFASRLIPMLASSALVLTLISGPARAAPSPVTIAFTANDIAALEALSDSATTAQQRMLAAGAALALRRKDDAAIRMLTSVTGSTASREVRATALLALAGVYLRDGKYGACYSALRSASELSPQQVTAADRQTMEFAHALAGIEPMRLAHAASGSLEITPDKAGLNQVPVQIDGHRLEAIIDTGAAFSTISASTAERLGIQMLSQGVSVGSSTEKAVGTRLGIARQLRIGNALLTKVVFIVLPDAALTFANGAYKINAIIGLPVFIALGRIEVAKPDFVYGTAREVSAGHAPQATPDMVLSGLEPLILVRLAGTSEPLRMVLDTGSNVTVFNHNLAVDAPALVAGLEQHAFRLGGAGGVGIDRKALRLPATTLMIGGRSFELKDVSVTSDGQSGSDGSIGQDVVGQGSRMTLDFRTMRFAVEH
jgi:predicted aspartyl protease